MWTLCSPSFQSNFSSTRLQLAQNAHQTHTALYEDIKVISHANKAKTQTKIRIVKCWELRCGCLICYGTVLRSKCICFVNESFQMDDIHTMPRHLFIWKFPFYFDHCYRHILRQLSGLILIYHLRIIHGVFGGIHFKARECIIVANVKPWKPFLPHIIMVALYLSRESRLQHNDK